ncbi:signal peptidase II [Mycoplasma sp. 'Moose RK']|uniref:signal peptidase II n=1 Tax=Mycoplasma sp. 'Moose RK' TaxID=2780095 RepID=UPI0018C31CBC|nr:signal peptidase II [Mycoplasma sp. 'Moose RK']MBG0730544.1 signal peptidase II [Mycoplasma sp. 'Moose RK']
MKLWKAKTSNFVQEKYRRIGKKRFFLNIVIAFFIVIILLLLDQLTKNLIFTQSEFEISTQKGFVKQISWWIIGFRPLLHQGVTSKINEIIGFTGIHIFALILGISLLISVPFSPKYFLTVFLAILMSGNIGNEIDRLLNNNTVKDILYFPFWPGFRGTFNFADVFIVCGPAGILIFFIIDFIRDIFRKNRRFRKKTRN